MKKIFLPVLMVTFVFVACNDNASSTENISVTVDSTLPPAVTMPSGTDTIVNSLYLSDNEMKDDSVFTDGSVPTSWANAGITDVKGLKLFLKQAQQWVMNNDKEKLAAVVKYPLKNIKNEQALIAAYDNIFTKEVKLSFATINFNQIFRNQQGVMTEGGKVWINQFGTAFKIFAINQ